MASDHTVFAVPLIPAPSCLNCHLGILSPTLGAARRFRAQPSAGASSDVVPGLVQRATMVERAFRDILRLIRNVRPTTAFIFGSGDGRVRLRCFGRCTANAVREGVPTPKPGGAGATRFETKFFFWPIFSTLAVFRDGGRSQEICDVIPHVQICTSFLARSSSSPGALAGNVRLGIWVDLIGESKPCASHWGFCWDANEFRCRLGGLTRCNQPLELDRS